MVTLETKSKLSNSQKRESNFFKPTIQKKLNIGSANDSYEIEADTMANKVMRMSESSTKKFTQTGALVQRKCADCEQEEKIQKKSLTENITPFIQRSSSESGGYAPNHVESQINSSRGGGSSLDSETKSFMENRFGTDFSDVKIHTGSQAVQMSRELNAQAFTVGNDIYFNEGKYSPNSDSGKHLLAHELTHTLQQGGGIGRKIQMQSSRRRTIDRPDRCVRRLRLIIDLSENRTYVYCDGELISRFTVSHGRRGHRTLIGTFGIDRRVRDIDHFSSTYGHCGRRRVTGGRRSCRSGERYEGASMQYFQPFYIDGGLVGFHQGSTREQSHGCIHVEHSDALWLWNLVENYRGHVSVVVRR